MERDYFLNKTRIGFAIITDDVSIDPVSFTETLQLTPSRSHRKGDTWISKHGGSLCTEPRTLWAIDSEWTVHEAETMSHHIEYFKNLLSPKAEIVQGYKEDSRFDVSFWIWIETDGSGIGLYLTDDELKFLNDNSNWIHFSMLTSSEEGSFEKSIAGCRVVDLG